MKKILLSFLLLFSALLLSAVPARPGRYPFPQPDGSTVMLSRHGDEWGHWLTDAQGRTVVKGADGFYRPVSETQAQNLRRQSMARREQARRVHAAHAPSGVAFGRKHFLVILVEFNDLEFSTANAHAAIHNLMNQPGYSANDSKGSAWDYYYQNSDGKFDPVFDVFGPVKLPKGKAYYGGNDKDGYDLHPEEAVAEACKALNDQIDFRLYDNDQDGDVDLVFMFYAGYSESDYPDDDALWPHQWELTSAGYDLKLDGKLIDSYACVSELMGYGGSKGKLNGIGTPCHEFAHALGLPDFYDTDYDTNGICGGLYDFSLMSGGNYNDNSRMPPYLNILERTLLGWVDENAMVELTQPGDYVLPPVQENKAYKTPTEENGEYFIYECRGESGWDAALLSPGLLVYHVDKSSRKIEINDVGPVKASDLWDRWGDHNAINENGSHPCFYIVAAADPGNLKYGYVSYSGNSYFDPSHEGFAANIPFPGAKGVTGYQALSWDGVESEMTLERIAYSGGQVTFSVKYTPFVPALDFYSIKNPGNGNYAVGEQFALQLNPVEGSSYSSVKWSFDSTVVNAASVLLKAAGSHVIEADISLDGGKRQIVTLEIRVQ